MKNFSRFFFTMIGMIKYRKTYPMIFSFLATSRKANPLRSSVLSVSLLLIVTFFFVGCVKDFAPSDSITTEVLTSTTEGLTNAVNGAYSLFKDHVEFNGVQDDNNMYLRQYFQLSDFASDDIVCAQVTEDPLFYSFSLNHSPTQTNTRYLVYFL